MSKDNFVGMCPSLAWFTNEMQSKLDANSHKSGWHSCTQQWLLNRLRQETKELERAIAKDKNVVQEAADVANFAMMIADNFADTDNPER